MKKILIISGISLLSLVFIIAGALTIYCLGMAKYQPVSAQASIQRSYQPVLDSLPTDDTTQSTTLRNPDNSSYKLSYLRFIRNPDYENVLISGGMHGNEPSGVQSILKILAALKTDPHKWAKYNLYILPCINPYGYERDQRYNAQGLDLDRDFSAPESAEIQWVLAATGQTKFKYCFDLHEISGARSMLYVYKYSGLPAASQALAQAVQAGFAIQAKPTLPYFRFIANPDGIGYYPSIITLFTDLTRKQLLAQYVPQKQNADAIIVEAGQDMPLAAKVAFHQTILQAYLGR